MSKECCTDNSRQNFLAIYADLVTADDADDATIDAPCITLGVTCVNVDEKRRCERYS